MAANDFGSRMTPVVRNLLFINIAVFGISLLLNLALAQTGRQVFTNQLIDVFALSSDHVLGKGWVWQLFTYMFLHGNFSHIIFNMIALYMFGSDLEERWGSREFLRFYLVCGIGAGFFIAFLPLLLGQQTVTTLGSSGAIFGLLLAYAVTWPERKLLFMFVLPIKAKYFVLIIGLISFYLTLDNSHASEISHVGHLGGLITGYLYILIRLRHSGRQQLTLRQRYRFWKQKQLWKKRQQELIDLQNLEDKVDALLEKISRHGIKSLSTAEKKFLERASREIEQNKAKPTSQDEISLH